jgi:hypothetical protein
MTLEDSSLLRTLESNRKDLDSKSQNQSSTHVNGLKTNSVLNQLKYFNVVTGLPPDLMHDLLEGCVRFTFTCLMKHLTLAKPPSMKSKHFGGKY